MPSTLPSTKCSGAVLGTEYRQMLPMAGAVQGVPSSAPQEPEAVNTVGRLALGSRQSPVPAQSETNTRAKRPLYIAIWEAGRRAHSSSVRQTLGTSESWVEESEPGRQAGVGRSRRCHRNWCRASLSVLTLCGILRVALGLWGMPPLGSLGEGSRGAGIAPTLPGKERKADQWQRWERSFAQQQLWRDRKLPLLHHYLPPRPWLSRHRDLPVLILADPEERVTAPCPGLPSRPPWRQGYPTENRS